MRYKVTFICGTTIRRSMPLETNSPGKALQMYRDILESAGFPVRTLNRGDWFIYNVKDNEEQTWNIRT